MVYDCSGGQKLLEYKPEKDQEYVVLVAMIVDTAIIRANSEKMAAERYEMPEMFLDKDIAVWAMTRKEFDEMMKAGEAEARFSDHPLHKEPSGADGGPDPLPDHPYPHNESKPT